MGLFKKKKVGTPIVIDQTAPDSTTLEYATKMHNIFCQHENPNGCDWAAEDGYWDKPHHAKWKDRASFGLTVCLTEEELYDFFDRNTPRP